MSASCVMVCFSLLLLLELAALASREEDGGRGRMADLAPICVGIHTKNETRVSQQTRTSSGPLQGRTGIYVNFFAERFQSTSILYQYQL